MEMSTYKKGEFMNTLLNIASGKILPLNLPERYFLVNADIMYYYTSPPDIIEKDWVSWTKDLNISHYSNSDIYEFMERTKMIFDMVYIYRFLEHVPMDKIEYFIYLLSTITKKGSVIDIIVPDYKKLAQMILDEKIDENFPGNNIILTTELLNQPPDPHCSIWTIDRTKYFWELEKRFSVIEESMQRNFEFDGRDIYLRFFVERV